MAASYPEICNVLQAIGRWEKGWENLALATVVEVQGSSYRRTGARMLIQSDGNWHGAISGGCLEGNALRRAREVMRRQTPRLVTYDTRTDASAKEIGASLGCNGLLQVWLEPLHPSLVDHLHMLHDAFLGTEKVWFQRVLEHAADENTSGMDGAGQSGAFEKGLSQREGLYRVDREGGEMLVAVEKVPPVPRLHIFGGGYDAQPLAELGKGLGWIVKVTDECAAKALPLRFPAADETAQHSRQEAVAALSPDACTAVVLLSHNFGYDKAVLEALLREQQPFYVGILGPRKRFERLDSELEGRLSAWEALHAPVGLDIGAETPMEIALAVVAEVQAAYAGRQGGKLRAGKGPIHTRGALREWTE